MTSQAFNSNQLLAVLPPAAPRGVDETLQVMDGLALELESAGLGHVIPFNTVYRTLTEKVQTGIATPGYFSQPETVARTVGIFADKYLEPLRAYAAGNHQAVSRSWQKLLYEPAARQAPEGVQFLLGMFAHIRLDLPQALVSSRVNDNYYQDYKRTVGDLIDVTAQELSNQYVPNRYRSRRLVTAAAVLGIARWRLQAWNDHEDLRASNCTTESGAAKIEVLDTRTARNGTALLKYGTLAMAHLYDASA